MPFDVVSAGILVADHLTTPIARLPRAGELVLCDAMPFSIGGCAANVSVDLTRLGKRVGVFGAVGGDPLGGFVVESLAKAGVDVAGIVTRDDCGTSCSLIINVAGEDRRFITTLGANAAFVPEQIPLDAVRQAKVLYLGGYLFAPALENERMVALFHAARAAGVKTVLDVVVAGEGIGRGTPWERLAPLLAETDVFLPNEDEARLITGKPDPVAQAEQFRAAGARTVVVTCGGAGSILVNDRVRLLSGVYPIDYVGGTGSGDAFDAGFIMGLLAGGDERECLRWGSAIGASCVRSVSATDGVFTAKEAQAFMAAHPLDVREL
ncbi:MAG: sugar kinase [Planctomycetota bacterium]|nr:MAG: sugar kinase [Planctomycetota bacterium]